MKGFRFYAELPTERGSKSGCKRFMPFTRKVLSWAAENRQNVNCVATPLDDAGRPLWQAGDTMDAVCAVQDVPNGGCCFGGVSREYLRKRCVRIPAALARKLHPALFTVLEG